MFVNVWGAASKGRLMNPIKAGSAPICTRLLNMAKLACPTLFIVPIKDTLLKPLSVLMK